MDAIKWFKHKTVEGAVYARYTATHDPKKERTVEVRPVGKDGAWAYYVNDNPFGFHDSKDAAKEAAVRYVALMSKPLPDPAVVFARGKKESVRDWLLRMARENGMPPAAVMASGPALKAAKIGAKDGLPPDELKKVHKEAFKLAKEWAKDHNAKVAKGEAVGTVQVSEESWFSDRGTDLQGLGIGHGEIGPEVEFVRESKEGKKRPDPTPAPSAGKTPKKATTASVPGTSIPATGKSTEVKPPKDGPGRDVWGTKLGTSAAAVNKAFRESGGKPMTSDDVWKKAGCAPRSGHLTWLKNRHFIERLPDGTWKCTAVKDEVKPNKKPKVGK